VTNVKATIAKLNENLNQTEKPSAPMRINEDNSDCNKSFEEIHQERRDRIMNSSSKTKLTEKYTHDTSPL